MWIANDMQGGCTLCACKLTAIFDQRTPNATFPQAGLYKKAVEFGLTIRSQQHSSEARDNAVPLSNKHPARSDVVERELDSVRVGKQSVAVAGIMKRGPAIAKLREPFAQPLPRGG